MGWNPKDLLNKGYDENGNKIKKTSSKQIKPSQENRIFDYQSFPWAIFIEGNVPSSKNDRMFGVAKNIDGTVKKKENGKQMIFGGPNQRVKEYKKHAIPQFHNNIHKWYRMLQERNPPYTVYFKIVREKSITEKGGYKFDYHNMIQIVADLMEECGWIKGDDARNVMFVPVQYAVDEFKQGVVIFV